jgi:dUTPase
VRNHGTLEAEIDPYTAMSRVVLLKQSGGAPNIVDTLETTERGESGYCSTGLK